MTTLFVSHGAPTLAIEPGQTGALLASLSTSIPPPKAILVISAHWDTHTPMVTAMQFQSTIHDFGGFPAAMYRLQYPAPGAPWLAKQVVELLAEEGIAASEATDRGLDHGAWVPLMLMYPNATIPVVQLSIQSRLSPEHHVQMGQALRALHAENILILASGAITHNLYDFFTGEREATPLPYVPIFADWVATCVEDEKIEQLCQYRTAHEFGMRAHPTPDHLLPLFVALGAGLGRAQRFQPEVTYGLLAMDVYRW